MIVFEFEYFSIWVFEYLSIWVFVICLIPVRTEGRVGGWEEGVGSIMLMLTPGRVHYFLSPLGAVAQLHTPSQLLTPIQKSTFCNRLRPSFVSLRHHVCGARTKQTSGGIHRQWEHSSWWNRKRSSWSRHKICFRRKGNIGLWIQTQYGMLCCK